MIRKWLVPVEGLYSCIGLLEGNMAAGHQGRGSRKERNYGDRKVLKRPQR